MMERQNCRARQTYFEQIPTAVVKTIAQEFSEASPAGNTNGNEEERTMSTAERWREIAQNVQREQDPKRMSELVEQLIAALDEEKFRHAGGAQAAKE